MKKILFLFLLVVCSSIVAAGDLMHYYTLDDVDTVDSITIDSVGSDNGLIASSTTTGIPGVVNQAYYLQSLLSFGNAAWDDIYGDVTIAFWRNKIPGNNHVWIAKRSQPGSFDFQIYELNDGYLRYAADGIEVKSKDTLNNEWMHIAITVSGNTLRMYTDGVLNKTAIVSPVTQSNIPSYFCYDGGITYCKGSMDEVRFYSRALSDSEILALAEGSLVIEECGDGIVSGSEECDDGNKIDGDGCNAECLNEFCGDNIINDVDEECDDGEDNGIPCMPPYGGSCSYCSNDCNDVTLSDGLCGDGTIDGTNEGCDDGNTENNDGCDSNCKVEVNYFLNRINELESQINTTRIDSLESEVIAQDERLNLLESWQTNIDETISSIGAQFETIQGWLFFNNHQTDNLCTTINTECVKPPTPICSPKCKGNQICVDGTCVVRS